MRRGTSDSFTAATTCHEGEPVRPSRDDSTTTRVDASRAPVAPAGQAPVPLVSALHEEGWLTSLARDDVDARIDSNDARLFEACESLA